MNIIEITQKKRDRHELSKEEIKYFVDSYVNGETYDYQMSSLLMAIFLNGLTSEELSDLTIAMLHSGAVLEHKNIVNKKLIIDKHSTGGVGDKVSIPLVPLVASAGVYVPMMAGRTLGHTGGTIDKLESIPNYNTSPSIEKFLQQIEEIGGGIVGQSDSLVPADKKIYSLRDASGTVESIPLIVSSILSKKLAEGISGLVFDVKFGSGAFMQKYDDALKLANLMIEIANNADFKICARLTSMEQPLGTMVGNSLEIKECIDVLKNKGPKDTEELTLELGAEMLLMSGIIESHEEALKILKEKLVSGEAYKKFLQIVRAQGGDVSFIEDTKKFKPALKKIAICANRSGFIEKIDNRALGNALVQLGGGRKYLGQPLDHAVGMEVCAKIGAEVKAGDTLAVLHANESGIDEASKLANKAFYIGEKYIEHKLFGHKVTNIK